MYARYSDGNGKKTGLRRFRRGYLRIPRKNGKSLLAIIIMLLLFAADGEPGAEIYLGATSQEQAKDLLFNPAKFIVEKDEKFQRRFGIEVNASNLVIPGNFSTFKSVIKNPDDGASPHGAVVDEYHKHKVSDQYDVFDTGLGARRQPFLLVTTTAGADLSTPCKIMDDDCINQLEGQFEDDSRLVLVFAPDKKDKWNSKRTLAKVNPNIGVSVSEDYLLDQLQIAKRTAAKQNDFKTKHLNLWVGAASPWMNLLVWQRQSRPGKLQEFENCPAHGGVDLASRKDCNAITLTWKNSDGEYFTKSWFFVPRAALEVNDLYGVYENSGELIVTEGNQTDQAAIEELILELDAKYDVKSWGFDDYQGDYIMMRLQDQGLQVVNYGSTVKNFSQPMKEIDALTDDGLLWNCGNGCMVWQMGNVHAFTDQKDNIFPRKANKDDPKCKIDGPVSAIMSMGRWLADDDEGSLDDFLSDPVKI